MRLLDASALHLDLTIPISDTAFDHVNAPVCGFSLSLKTAHRLRMQALLQAPQRAPRSALSVSPSHFSPTLAILTSLTLLVAITILCKAAFHASIALSFKFHKSHPSVHVDLHYFAFLRWVDDARAILLTVPPAPNISDSTFPTPRVPTPRLPTPRLPTLVPSCSTAVPMSRTPPSGGPCSVSFFPLHTLFHSLSGLTNGMMYIAWEDVVMTY